MRARPAGGTGWRGGERAVSDAPLRFEFTVEQIDAIAERVAERLAERDGRDNDDGWLDVKDAAAYLSCPRSRIYALVSADRIPHERDGSRLLFRRSELDAWLR